MRSPVLLLLLLLLAACTPARKEVEGNIVRRIRFEGNGGWFSGHTDLQLRRQMEQDSTSRLVTVWPFLYWIDPEVLDTRVLQRDAYRLEVWYAHNGWFEAAIFGWELRQIRPQTDTKAGVVDIHGYVDPGPPSLVRAFDIRGMPRLLRALEATARRESSLVPGEQFKLADVEATRADLLRLLLNHSYAYAQVEAHVEAHPSERAVDVAYEVSPGIQTVYGDIRITGQDRIPEAMIRDFVPLQSGSEYKLDELQATRQRLFEMSTFSLVTVEPDLSDPTSREVPIHISVTETRFRRFRIGGGAEFASGNVHPRVSAQFQHVNLFNRLVRWEVNAAAGAAFIIANEDAMPEVKPTYNIGSSLTWPRIAGQRLDLEVSGQVLQDVQAGLWLYRQPQADVRLVWRPNRATALRIGPHVEEYRYLTLTDDAARAARRIFGTGTEFVNPYQLTALDQSLTIDWRDDPLNTTRGSLWGLTLREALPLTEGGFSFISASGEGRIFRPIRFRPTASRFPFIFAGRLRSTYIHAFGDRGVPYPELAFLGGPNSIRGFRPNQVGPYDTLCSDSGDDVQRFHLPLGGTFATESTLELRHPWAHGIVLATFVDAGVLERRVRDLGFEDFRWSWGVGARYETIIGPVRFDLSFRPLYPEDEGPNTFINCDHPHHRQPRAFDFFSSFESIRNNPDRHPPFAMVFYLAIGEAL